MRRFTTEVDILQPHRLKSCLQQRPPFILRMRIVWAQYSQELRFHLGGSHFDGVRDQLLFRLQCFQVGGRYPARQRFQFLTDPGHFCFCLRNLCMLLAMSDLESTNRPLTRRMVGATTLQASPASDRQSRRSRAFGTYANARPNTSRQAIPNRQEHPCRNLRPRPPSHPCSGTSP